MIDCPNAEMRDRLPDLANDSLSPELRAVVIAHVGECAACAAEVEILRVARLVVIARTPRVNVAKIVQALPQIRAVRPISRARSWATWQIAAAVTVLVAGVGSFSVMRERLGFAGRDTMAVAAVVTDTTAGLAMTGNLVDLSETELQDLVEGINKIEALPSTEVETTTVGLPGTAGVEIPDSIIRDLEGT